MSFGADRRAIKLGTRGSLLALRQTEIIAAAVVDSDPGLAPETVTIVTTGDRKQSDTGSVIRDKREWVHELELALLDRQIDLAVHSGKDVPVDIAPGTTLIPVLNREAPEDILIVPPGILPRTPVAGGSELLSSLPAGSRIGTASLRRTAQLRRARNDLVPIELRGNVPTRIEKLLAGKADGLVIARAGVQRLLSSKDKTADSAKEILSSVEIGSLPEETFLPAVNQGILVVQIRTDDERILAVMKRLCRPAVLNAFSAERAFIATIGADCRSAVGVLARESDRRLELFGAVYSKDGHEAISGSETGPAAESKIIGAALGQALLARGAGRLLN